MKILWNKNFAVVLTALLIIGSSSVKAQNEFYEPYNANKVESSFLELGKMWTFDDIPYDFWGAEHEFTPTKEWLDDVRMSALQFGRGCSSAFVSADGLIMTNHHCGRNDFHLVQKEEEDLLKNGFYATTLEEERKIPNLFVDQLLLIEDVTDEIISAMNEGTDDKEKVDKRETKINELVAKYNEESGLTCSVVTLYNGGKYSLYGYKRYDDVRLVMAPDFQIAATGWDWDNFTYPRYELDFAFYRAYENGEPVKTDHFFEWSDKGAEVGESIFMIGRPGRTNRLISVEEMEYQRDKFYPVVLRILNETYYAYSELFENYPDRESQLLNEVMGWGNARKSFAGSLKGLRDENILLKKKDFQQKLQAVIANNPELNAKYSKVWESIGIVINDLRVTADESLVLPMREWFKSSSIKVAENVIKYAKQMQLPEDERGDEYKKEKLAETIEGILPGEMSKYDDELNELMVKAQHNVLTGLLGNENSIVNNFYHGKKGNDAVDFVLAESKLLDKSFVEDLLTKSPDEILNCRDPFMQYLLASEKRLGEIMGNREELNNTLAVQNQLLGEAIYAAFGDNISPDATSTLRISDGKIEGYEYNGTLAPAKTTYYGLWDRYNSFDKKTYPWGLHPRWKMPPAELDLSIPIGVSTTNDSVGGNSGSSLINKKGEVIGLIHDGNLESLAGYFIFLPENNRAVATDSYGLMEALKYVFKADRLVKELQQSEITQ